MQSYLRTILLMATRVLAACVSQSGGRQSSSTRRSTHWEI